MNEIEAIFYIGICAYPLCIITISLFCFPINVSNKNTVESLTDIEVKERWRRIYTGQNLIQRLVNGEKPSKEHHDLIAEIVGK